MRTASIFFDTKLISPNQNLSSKPPEKQPSSLQTPRSLVCSNLQGFLQPNLFGRNIACEKHTARLSHVSGKRVVVSFACREIKDVIGTTSKMKLFFSSLEAKDLQDGLDLFQNYLCSLTNQLSTLQKYQPLVDHKPLTEWLPLGYKVITPGVSTAVSSPVSEYYDGQINARLKIQGLLPQSRPIHLAPLTCALSIYFAPLCSKVAKQEKSQSKGSKLGQGGPNEGGQRSQNIAEGRGFSRSKGIASPSKRLFFSKVALAVTSKGAGSGSVLKAVSLLRALRDIHSSLNVLSIPQPTSLYTVIKSPHVFKKTREQFATTANKKALTLYLSSKVARSLVLESFLLLKLPCEVKIKA